LHLLRQPTPGQYIGLVRIKSGASLQCEIAVRPVSP
jgi:hypothetical protein